MEYDDYKEIYRKLVLLDSKCVKYSVFNRSINYEKTYNMFSSIIIEAMKDFRYCQVIKNYIIEHNVLIGNQLVIIMHLLNTNDFANFIIALEMVWVKHVEKYG